MVKLICDKCGKDCDLCAYDITIASLHNPVPHHRSDIGLAQISCDNTRVRFVLCQECYAEHGLPNIYFEADKKPNELVEFEVPYCAAKMDEGAKQ